MTDVPARTQPPAPNAPVYATPLRRLGAMLYDSLLCTAILMLPSAFLVPFLTAGREIGQISGPGAVVYRSALLIVLALFFCYFWTRKGRTLGMQVWKLRIQTMSGSLPSWRDSLLRFLMACVPLVVADIILTAIERFVTVSLSMAIGMLIGLPLLNYLSGYFDAERRALHERFLTTRIVRA